MKGINSPHLQDRLLAPVVLGQLTLTPAVFSTTSVFDVTIADTGSMVGSLYWNSYYDSDTHRSYMAWNVCEAYRYPCSVRVEGTIFDALNMLLSLINR